MKKLTDESVAKALGWRVHKRTRYKTNGWLYWWCKPGQKKPETRGEGPTQRWGGGTAPVHVWPPAFTTDLNLIVAEVEARGLVWRMIAGLEGQKPSHGASAQVGTQTMMKLGWGGRAKTPALALCAALLAYLKEHHD